MSSDMIRHKIGEIVKNPASFIQYQSGILTYCITVVDPPEKDGYIRTAKYYFDIDANDKADVGTGAFLRKEKGVILMRWFRRAMEQGTLDVVESLAAPPTKMQIV